MSSKSVRSIAGDVLSLLQFSLLRRRPGTLSAETVQSGNHTNSYQVFVPSSLKSVSPRPLIVFLHGIGQRGEGGVLKTKGARAGLVQHYLGKVPAVIMVPQCEAGKYWSNPEMDRMVMSEIEQASSKFDIDQERIYLTGVSMGGYGVWSFAMSHPGKFAALVTVCGGNPLKSGDRVGPIVEAVGNTPAWLFHGARDAIVPAADSRSIFAALRARNANARYNEYPDAGHNVWMDVIREKNLVPWILEQRLNTAEKGI